MKYFRVGPFLGSVALGDTRIRPVLVKNMIILASYVNKWTFILEKFTLLERLSQRQYVWPKTILVYLTYIARDEF